MRHAGGAVLGILWALLLLAYSAPLWKPGAVSWDFAVSVHPPLQLWMVGALAAVLLALPPFALGLVTWRWVRRNRHADNRA